MIWILIGLGCLFFGAISAVIALERGGDGLLGFVLGLFLGPFGAILCFWAGGADAKDRRMVEDGLRKQCPRCKEVVRPNAHVCKFCHHDFSDLILEVADVK